MQENTLFSLKGKTILVTGASAGLGKQIAIDCSKMGANLVITGRNSERLKETLDMLSFGRHICRTVNLTDEVERSFFVEAMPSLDGIVHCAGINKVMPCSFIKENNYNDIFKINLEAPIFLQKSILKAKKLNNNASVVFISSIASKYSSIGNSVYSASKAGLNLYAKTLAKEIANKKIRVNCVLPGMIKTGLNQTLTSQEIENDVKSYPLGRYAEPSDISPLVVYLLSDSSSWMTGSEIVIDGGKLL